MPELKMIARDAIKAMYLDYFNNFLTLAKWAEVNHVSVSMARELIDLGRRMHNADCTSDAGDVDARNPHK